MALSNAHRDRNVSFFILTENGESMKTIGITTTVPVEVLLAAGYRVTDLNNIFITSEDYGKYIDIAERDGFPRSSCAWIKGIYGVCLERGINEVVGVLEGDCSNTGSMVEVLKLKGITVYPFSYPANHDKNDVTRAVRQFMELFRVDPGEVENIRQRLNQIRSLAKKIDQATYKDNTVSGFENHLSQICFSDFNGDPDHFEKELKNNLADIRARIPMKQSIRLGYIGVPPMTADIYDYVESLDARVVYNEVQREFAFPRGELAGDIFEQYYDYTYPYDINIRLREIIRQITERNIHGLIHYTQAFCHRAIEDIVIKDRLEIPVLNIEGDKLNHLDSRTKLRIEAFLDMLGDKIREENYANSGY